MDLLLRRYGGGIDYLLRMPLDDAARLIQKAQEAEVERQAWEIWLAVYPHMEKPIPFDQFYREIKKEQIQHLNVSAEDIIRKAERIRQADRTRGGDPSATVQDVR